MNICINIHNNPRNVHKNEKSSRHLDKKWYHGVRVKRSKSRSCLHDKAFERRSRSDCVHEQVAKRIANVRFTLGPAKHEKVAIYVVNQRISNVCRIAGAALQRSNS